jgi:hypothetical protein
MAVVDVWWLRKSARVRGPDPAPQIASTISSALLTGSRMGVRTYRAPKSPQTCSQVRSSEPYSRSVESTSSPRLELERAGGDVQSRRCVRDEHQVVRISADVSTERRSGLCEQRVQPAGEKQHRLPLELELPLL